MKQIAVYFDSWASKWVGQPGDMDLAKLDLPGLTIVNLAFVKPDLTYAKGQGSFAGTGLDFSQEFWVVKGAISILRARGIKVMLSVGGSTYNNWDALNTASLDALVMDLGVDGVDIDWEVGGVRKFYGLIGIICEVHDFVHGSISIAAFSTGAFGSDGVDQWKGSAIPAMVHCSQFLSWINIMAYDAGAGFDSVGAYDCYRIYYPGDLLLGFEVGPPGWGGYLLTTADVQRGVDHVKKDGTGNGVFVWSVGSNESGTPSVRDICTLANKSFQ